MANLNVLKASNERRWAAAKLTRGSEFKPVAARLCAADAKARYMAIAARTGVPWFVIAVIHQREASGPPHWDKQLAQGDPLNQVSTHVPKGLGPFLNHPNDPPLQDAFYRGALIALIDCAPYAARNKDWSVGGALTLLEQYNGLGYANKGIPSPYIWSGTDQYVRGKYIADGVFSATAVDQQLGCAGLIMAMMEIDATIKFGTTVVPMVVSTTQAPVVPAHPDTVPSITNPAPGSIGAWVSSIFKKAA